MKKLYTIIFLLLGIASAVFAQTGNVFHLNKLSKNDTLLTGWKFQPGDNPLWGNPTFNDSQWTTIDPAQDVTKFPALKKAGKGWIRLHIKLDSSLTKKSLTAWVLQYTASEIFLNGKLLKRYGVIGPRPSNTKAFCPSGELFDLPLQPGTYQVIAVRLAYQSGLPYTSPYFTPLSAFSIYVNDYHNSFINIQENNRTANQASTIIGIFCGMLLIVCIIYFFYYLFDKKQMIHLYYSISCALFFVNNLFFSFFASNIAQVGLQMWVSYLISVTFVINFIFLLLTVYKLFDYTKRGVAAVLAMAGTAALIYNLYDDVAGFILATNVFLFICMLEAIRVSAWAIRQKKKGAGIILSALIIVNVLNVWSALLPQSDLSSIVILLLAFFGFPLGMAIYLAVQNAITNQTLRSTLLAVSTLSEQNMLKEQEKQQILANQNIVLETQVTERTAELNQSLAHLKNTQTQLIQSEKMASLGELTAGIAHEIQNPLNFVNNFSEVSIEILEELQAEAKAGHNDDVIEIAGGLTQNLQKINQHGKRADAIVKGMLEHSRIGSGVKEPTNLNKLADDYLRLAYHGLRAKDKSFNAELITNFDESLQIVNVIPQDIGRVLLNLFNNAFYAVQQKAKTAGVDYKPEVSVFTSSESGHVVIVVRDNGNGIPDAIQDKIMQPFFTTKPTGEGTGLGLSLTYDMVVKGHGGTIQVISAEGEGSEFIVCIPLN